jgi:FdhD protein
MLYQGIKHTQQGDSILVEDAMVIEKPLRISINGTPFTITLRMPGNEKALGLGLLYAEDIIKNTSSIHMNYLEDENELDLLEVTVPAEQLKEGYLNSRNFLSVSSCGMCGKTELPQLYVKEESLKKWLPLPDHLSLETLFETMKIHQPVFLKTGGCHAAAAFTAEGALLYCHEDIGRHNAVDKVVGDLLLNNQLQNAQYLLVSGRVSYEIIVKTFRANIPVLAAVSAPSSLAIDYAKELGVRLIGFCRGKQFTVYS